MLHVVSIGEESDYLPSLSNDQVLACSVDQNAALEELKHFTEKTFAE